MSTQADVVVVGAGAVGCAAARALATDREVVVLERGQIAGEATGKASGVVSLQAHYEYAPGAATYAREFIEDYDGHRNVEYTRRPRVALATSEQAPDARAYADFLCDRGFEAAYLDSDDLEARFPGVFELDSFVGAVVVERMGWLDPYTFTTALARDAEERGADVRTGVEVERVRTADGRVTGVETDDGVVDADHVVVAAGWRTRPLLAGLVEVPVRPERYQTVNLETDIEFDENYPMGSASDPGNYWRPEHNGDLHVGGGAHLVETPGRVQTRADEAVVMEIAEHMPGRLKGLGDARLASDDVCPTGDAVTRDRYPILDAPAEAPEGLVVATGFSGYGVMAAPFAGAAVRGLVAGDEPPFATEHFRLARFTDRSADFPQPTFPAFSAHAPASME